MGILVVGLIYITHRPLLGLIYRDHCALRARKQGRRSHLTRCCLCTAATTLLVHFHYNLVHYCYHNLHCSCSCMHTRIGEVATSEQMCSAGSCAGDFWCWWRSGRTRGGRGGGRGVNSASGFLRKPLDLLHPHQSVMLVRVSQFHHFYSIP